VEIMESSCLGGGNVNWCSHCEKQYGGSSKNLKELPYDPVIPPLGLPEENKNTNLISYMHSYVYCSIIYNSQDMEATQVSTKR